MAADNFISKANLFYFQSIHELSFSETLSHLKWSLSRLKSGLNIVPSRHALLKPHVVSSELDLPPCSSSIIFLPFSWASLYFALFRVTPGAIQTLTLRRAVACNYASQNSSKPELWSRDQPGAAFNQAPVCRGEARWPKRVCVFCGWGKGDLSRGLEETAIRRRHFL